MSKKRKGSVPVTQKKQENNIVYHLSGVEAAMQSKPYYVPGFRSGAWENKKFKRKGKNGSRAKINKNALDE